MARDWFCDAVGPLVFALHQREGMAVLRTATLHDGQTLTFPDETPDDVMHATVKRHMGLPPPEPPPPDPVVVAQQQTQQIVAGAQQSSETLTKATAALYRQIGDAVISFEQQVTALAHATANQNDTLANLLSETTKTLQHTTQAAAASINAVHQSMNEAVAKLLQVAEEMRSATAQSAQNDAAGDARTREAIEHTRTAVQSLAQKLDASTARVVEAVRAPKKAVKDKDGNWISVPKVS